jgi:hypothetical protein
LAGLLLGSLVGFGVFAWIPTVPQVLLTLAMIAEASYCQWRRNWGPLSRRMGARLRAT